MGLPTETGLGTDGVRNKGPGALDVLRVDRIQGWQTLRSVSGGNDSAVTDMSAVLSDAIYLPDEGDLLQIRAISQAAGAVTVEIYCWPYVASDGETGAVGAWKETVVLTTAATENAKGIGNATLAATASPASPSIFRNKAGAYRMAARITTRAGTDSEIVYRVI